MNRVFLYADWCCARHALRLSARSSVIAIALTMAMTLLGGHVSIYSIDATGLVSTLGGLLLGLSALLVVPRLFLSDEQDGWGEFRLALPVTRSQVVGSRYAVVAVIVVVTSVVAQCLGLLLVLVTRLFPQVFGTWTLDASLPVKSLLVAAVMLVMAGLQMAVYFALGLERARLASMIPVLGIMLVFADLWRSGVLASGGAIAGLAQGDPAVFVALAVVLCIGVYLLSFAAARWRFAKREL